MRFFRLIPPSGLLKPPSFVKTPFLLSYLLICAAALVTLIFYFRIQPEVPIFYSLARPVDHLAFKAWLAVFPVGMFVITLIHTAVVNIFKMYDQLLIQLFAWATFVVELLLVLALFRIIYLVA